METVGKTLLDFQADWVRVVDKGCADYNSLSTDERVWFNLESLIGQVDNGGLISHYYNSGADHNKETMEDLISLGFSDIADLLIQINSLFSNRQPPTNMDERNDIISSWPDGKYDDFFEKLDGAFYRKEKELENSLVNYIEAKILKR